MPHQRSIAPAPGEPLGGKTPRRSLQAIPLDADGVDILVAVLAEIEALPYLGTELEAGATRSLAELRDVGIPYRPGDWFGGPLSPARRKAYSRAATRLEDAGLVLRVTEPNRDRVTHLQPTAAGLRRAMRLVGRRADLAAIAEGLRRTAWGGHLAEVVSD